MTSPIDVAYVEIRPDVDNFDRAVEKDLDSTFRKMEARALKSTQKVEQRFDELEDELHENFKEIDRQTTEVFENFNKIVDKTTIDVVEKFEVTGDRIGDSFNRGLGDGLDENLESVRRRVQETHENIERDTDESVDRVNDSFRGIGRDIDVNLRDRDRDISNRLLDVGQNAGLSLGQGILSSFQTAFSSEVLKTTLLAVAIPAAILAAPLIGTALSSAIVAALPLGFIGLAIFSQLDNPQLQQAGRGFANSVKNIFKNASEGLTDNLVLGLDTILNSFQRAEPTINRIFDALEPLTQPLAEGIGGFIENILPGIATAIENSGPVIEEFALGLSDLGTELGDFFAKLSADPEALAGGMRNLFDFIIYTIRELGNLLSFLINVFDNVKGFITALFDLFQFLGQFIVAAAKMAVGTWQDFYDFWRAMWNGAIAIAEFIIGKVIRAAFWLRDNWRDVLNAIGKFFVDQWNRIRSGFDKVINGVVNAAKGLINRIKGAANWGSILYNAGRDIINGLINGIKSAFGSLQGLLNRVTNLIPDWKGPMEKDRKLLQPTGKAIIKGLETGMAKEIPNLRDQLFALTNNIGILPAAGLGATGGISVNMTFYGPTPSARETEDLGRAAGRGVRDALNARAVRTAVRMS